MKKMKSLRRYVWEDYRDEVYVFTHTDEGKKIYAKRKEKIKHSFAESKEPHGLRYCVCAETKEFPNSAYSLRLCRT